MIGTKRGSRRALAGPARLQGEPTDLGGRFLRVRAPKALIQTQGILNIDEDQRRAHCSAPSLPQLRPPNSGRRTHATTSPTSPTSPQSKTTRNLWIRSPATLSPELRYIALYIQQQQDFDGSANPQP